MVILAETVLAVVMCQIGRVGCRDIRSDALLAMSFRETRIRQTSSRFKERGLRSLKSRHGGPASGS
jgi:hypothetical protein